MPAPVFEPDPLLSRSAPKGRGAFDVVALLAPARPVFRAEAPHQDHTAHGRAEAPAAAAVRTNVTNAANVTNARDATGAADEAVATDIAEPSAAADLQERPHGVTATFTENQVQEMLALRYREGFEEGLAQGASLSAQVQAESPESAEGEGPHAQDATAELLQSVGRALLDLNGPQGSAERFEPLKRLALHLATEIARVELSVSAHAVDRLVQRCVESLDARGMQVVVELNPQDLGHWRSWIESGGAADAALQGVQFREDASLSRGSVRARSDHACVEDLIEHRLAGLVRDLRIDAQRWQTDQAALGARVDDAMAARDERGADEEGPGDA